jgi:serine/threonine kinase 3
MEYCGGGSIYDMIKVLGPILTETEIASIMSSTIHGLQYLHSKRIIHRDLKAGK